MTNTYNYIGNQITIIKANHKSVNYTNVIGELQNYPYKARKNKQILNLTHFEPNKHYYVWGTNISVDPNVNNFVWTDAIKISKPSAILLLQTTKTAARLGEQKLYPLPHELVELIIDYGAEIAEYYKCMWITNDLEPTPFQVLRKFLSKSSNPKLKIQRKQNKQNDFIKLLVSFDEDEDNED
jgi:ribosomal protein L31E